MKNPPHYDLCLVTKKTDEGFQTIGCGWDTDKGDITLKLNRGTVISWRDMVDHALYVFKRKEKKDPT